MKKQLLIIAGLIGLAATSRISFCQQGSKPRNATAQMPPLTWTQLEWTGDSKPFQKVRSDIDSLLAGNQLTKDLLQRYKKLAQKDPDNSKAQFRWAYAIYKAPYAGIRFDNKWRTLEDARWALAQAKSSHIYEYARLQFLITARLGEHPNLKRIGERLLRQNRKDYDVEYYLVSSLSIGNDKERAQALTYAQEMVRLYPSRASAYGTLGRVYEDLWFKNYKQPDADRAIAAYEKYLSLTPSTAANTQSRSDTQYLIKLIRKSQSEKEQ